MFLNFEFMLTFRANIFVNFIPVEFHSSLNDPCESSTSATQAPCVYLNTTRFTLLSGLYNAVPQPSFLPSSPSGQHFRAPSIMTFPHCFMLECQCCSMDDLICPIIKVLRSILCLIFFLLFVFPRTNNKQQGASILRT